MTIDELLTEISDKGILLRRSGDDLILLGDRKSLSPALASELRSHKLALLEVVGADGNLWSGSAVTIRPEMLPLVRLTQAEIDKIVSGIPGGAANVQDIYALTPMQEGIFFHHLMKGEGDPYLMGCLFSFDSRRRLECYLAAMQAVVDRHDILRTTLVWEGLPEPVQVVRRMASLLVEELELDPSQGDVEKQLSIRFNPRYYRIDMTQGLLRLFIAEDKQKRRWHLMQLLHHLAGDHTTLELMQAELQMHLLGRAHQLPAPLPFRNLVAQARLGVSLEEHEAFFRQMLGDVEEPTAPFGLLDTQGDGTGIKQARTVVENPLGQRIRERACQLGVSAASLWHLAWALVLARVSGRDDVVFGTVLFGRLQGGAGADRTMGLFMNTLPLRIKIGDEGLEESVRHTHQLMADLLRHEHASLALAQRCSAVASSTPLFSALLNYSHTPGEAKAPTEEELRAWEGIEGVGLELRTNYPFMLAVEDLGDGFRLMGQTVAHIEPMRLCDFMRTAIERIIQTLDTDPATPTRAIDVLPELERQQLSSTWNEADSHVATNVCMHDLFEEQVRKTPLNIAVVYEGAQLSYAELNARANQLAHHLREMGVGPEVLVGIFLERSLDLVVALLGIWKAGGAYLPIDPSNPAERLAALIEDARIPVLITVDHLQHRLPSQWVQILCLDTDGAAIREQSRENPVPASTAENLAYAIYTSGSTGKPKAVGIEHRQSVSYVRAVSAEMRCAEGWRFALLSTVAADLGNTALFSSLCNGGELHVISNERGRDPRLMRAYFREHSIDCTKITPSHLASLQAFGSANDLMPACLLVLGGEASLWQWIEELQKLRPECRIMNHYGPTECTVGVVTGSVDRMTRSSSPNIPLGRPLNNSAAYVLDKEMRVQPIGVAGELYIGGVGVGRGYLGRERLTAEKFVPDPFSSVPGARLYRTGDKARWNSALDLEFLGRIDDQVKVRGFRVELGEIESVLNELPGVQQSAVLLKQDEYGQERLVAYIVPRSRLNASGGASHYRLPNNLIVAHQNKNETDYLYREIFENQVYFQHKIELEEDACVFDIGANIGMFTLFVTQRCPKGRIYSFEPISQIFECLKNNAALFEHRQAKAFQMGLSNHEQRADFAYYSRYSMMSSLSSYSEPEEELETIRQTLRNQRDSGDSSAIELLTHIEGLLAGRFESRTEKCQLRRLSDVIREEGVERIDLLKIDVQRAELDVLLGINDEDWDKIGQIVMEVHDGVGHKTQGRLQQVLSLLETRGFYTCAEQYGELRGTDRWNLYASRTPEEKRNKGVAPVVAKVTGSNNEFLEVTTDELRKSLARRLPDYMVPNEIVVLSTLPLTPNGKLDRRALLPVEAASRETRSFVSPRNQLEELICGAWEEVLQTGRVGVTDNFFELGGHSLLATRLILRLQNALNLEIPLTTLFTSPVLSDWAVELERLQNTKQPIEPIVRGDRHAFRTAQV
jgi:amino acid adenylation domain-containing protein/FkbM family methyltransferase